jgi:glyoxylase-like metal-dependent hydrolase (beta-lactamase superfamily II)
MSQSITSLTRTALFVLALLIATGSHAAEPMKTANIAERGLKPSDFPRWHAIVPNIYAYEDLLTSDNQTITTNSLIVLTSDGVVIVDGQDNPKQGQALAETIRKLTPQPVKYMIIGSDHQDHVGANPTLKATWPGIVFVSSPASQKTMLNDKREIVASELVSDHRTLRLGGTQIQIINLGRGHTGGDLVVYLPQSKVMFMSELYTRYVFPPMITGFPREWAATIRKAQAMDAIWYIPGHGFTDSDAATLKADLNVFLKAIDFLIAQASEQRAAGVPCESEQNCPASGKVNWGEYAKWTLFRQQAPRALARTYRDLDGTLPK